MQPKMTVSDAAKFLDVSVQAVSKKIKKEGIKVNKVKNRVFLDHQAAKKLFSLDFNKVDKKIYAFLIVKGGTGKTTLLFNLAVRLNLYGARVLCIDMDQQGNLTSSFGVNPLELPVMVDVLKGHGEYKVEDCIAPVSDGLDIVPSRMENAVLDNVLTVTNEPLDKVYKKHINSIKDNYDFIFIDCPPSLGASVTAVVCAADQVIAPVEPHNFSISGLNTTANELQHIEEKFEFNIALKVLQNKFDSRTILSQEVLSYLYNSEQYKQILYKTCIRASQDFPNAFLNFGSIFDSVRPTTAKDDIDAFIKEFISLAVEERDKEKGSYATESEIA